MPGLKSVSFTGPYGAEEAELERRRRMAEMLQGQAAQPLDAGRQVGGWAIPISPWEGAAKLAQGASAGYQDKRSIEMAKALRERQQADRGADMQTLAAMLKGSPGGLQADAADNVTQMPAQAPGIDPARLGALRSPEMQGMGMNLWAQQMARENAPPEREDLGDKIGLVKNGQIVGYLPKGATPDATLRETGANQRHLVPSGSAQLGAQTTLQTHATPSGSAILGDQRARSEGALNRGVQVRGQDLTASTAARGQDIRTAPNRPLSATAQKELFEADDVANSARNAIDILQSIIKKDPKTGLSQNDAAYEGGTANVRRIGMSFIPGQYESENATVDLQNKVTGQALESLRAIFGGMPTEGERKILIELQGSVNQKASQREAIFKRAIDLAEKRMKFSQDKAKKLREGSYFGAGVSGNQDGSQVSGEWEIVR